MARRKDSNDDEPKNENLNNDSDDSFGLPEINYEPLKKKEEPAEETPEKEEQEVAPVEPDVEETISNEEDQNEEYQEEEQPVTEEGEEAYEYKPYEEESSIWPKILGIAFVIVLAAGAAWFFLYYQPQQKATAEKAKIEAQQKAATQKAKEDADNKLRLERQAAEKRRQDSLAAIKTPAAGTIETLSARTGRYYVVIASAIDRDLLMDYAKKLGAKGVSSKIIPPFGKHKVSRLTIAEGETFNVTQAKADEFKGEYGSALWVLKY